MIKDENSDYHDNLLTKRREGWGRGWEEKWRCKLIEIRTGKGWNRIKLYVSDGESGAVKGSDRIYQMEW